MQGLLPLLHLTENTLLNGGICLIDFQVPVNGKKKLNSFSFLVLLLIQYTNKVAHILKYKKIH